MKMKKVLGLVCSLCMMMQTIPGMSVQAEAVQERGINDGYIVNDQFASGVDGWVAGEVNSGMDKATLANVGSYTDRDGVTATGLMKVEFTGNGGDWNSNTNQTAHREFSEPITYEDGGKVVVKTRILQTGAADKSTFSFLHNRPNTAVTDAVAGGDAKPNNAIRAGAYYYNDYLLFYAKKDSNSSDLRYGIGYNPNGNVLNTSTADRLTNRWIDVTMVIDGKNNKMTMKASANGDTAIVENIDIKQNDAVYRNKYGTNGSGGPNQTFFDALESLSIQQRNSANTVYVDFVQVYEMRDDYIINDQFSNGTDGWVSGMVDSSKTSSAKMSTVESYADANGVKADGVLKVEVGTPAEYNVGGQPNIYRAFDEPYTYKDGKKVVVKTRVLHTSEGYGRFDLMHNRKNTTDTDTTGDSITDNAYSSHYTLFDVRGDKNNVSYPSSVSGNTVNTTEAVKTGNIANKWIDVLMVIDGKNDSMTITTTVDGITNTSTTSIKQPKSVYVRQFGATPESGWSEPPKWSFDALESLTFLQRTGDDTLYIDYVQVYEYKKEAKISVNSTYKPGEAITVTFETEEPTEAFKDAVDLYDAKGNKVEATNTIDSTNKVVTITPAKALKDGESYYVEINADKFPADYKIDETKKTFKVSSYILDNTFTSGTTEGWVVGAIDSSKTSPAKMSAEASYTDANGVTADGVLKVEVGTPAEYNVGGQPNIYRALAEPYTYKDDVNLVVKTRVLHLSEGYGRFNLMHNRKNTTDTDTTGNSITDNSYSNHYTLFDVRGDKNNVSYPSSVSGNTVNTTEAVKTGNIANKWIDVLMVIDGKNDQMTITTTVDGITNTSTTSIKQPKSVYVRQFGATPESGWSEPPKWSFDALESLTFLQRAGDDTLYIDYVQIYEENVYTDLVDAEGKVIPEISEGITVYPEFVIKPEDAESKTYMVMSAMYVDGKLSEAHSEEITTGNKYVDPVGYTLGDDIYNVVIKTFIWENDTQKPLLPAKEYKKNYAEIYVSTTGSDVTGDGTLNAPYASIQKAVESSNDDGEIIVGGGEYYVEESISVTGSKKKIIKAAEGETPVIKAGIVYNLANAEKVTNSDITSRLVDPNAADNLYVLDLTSEIDVEDILPVGYPGSYDANEWLEDDVSRATCSVIMGDTEMTIARYPNDSYMDISSVKTDLSANSQIPFDIGYDSTLASHAEKWAAVAEADSENQPLMFGYWNNDWATQTVPMVAVDTASKTISSGHPSVFGAKEGQRFYVFNMLEEIDMPYEYFIDRNTGKMYFYKPTDVKEDTEILLTVKEPVFNITADNVIIDGIKISGSGSNGINATGNNIKIINCEISNLVSTGIRITGSNNLVEKCKIYNVNGGIKVSGGDLKTLTPADNVVKNCEIYNFSKNYKTYTSAISLSGVGNTATKNVMYDGEHRAMNYSGCYNTISYNEIYNVCTEVDDAGAIYQGRSWIDRGNKIINNYFHDIKSEIETTHGVGGIFFDDHYAAGYVEGNVFENIEGVGVRGNGGREHTITNNVFVNCDKGVHISDASKNENNFSSHISELQSSYYKTDVWAEAFPELSNIENNYPYENRDNVFTKNLFVKCDKAYTLGTNVEKYIENSNNYSSFWDPGFKNMSKRNYTITAETMNKRIPGFKTIEFESMGNK